MIGSGLSFRTVFISDIHLGSADCQAGYLLDFLRATQCETLYLVGDIIDLIAMRRRTHWPQSHTAVVKELVRKARAGTRVVYIPGNHDAELRALSGSRWAGIGIRRSAVHRLDDGRRFLIAHGDEFDDRIPLRPILRAAGDLGHALLLRLNRDCNRARRRLGLRYWPLAVKLKERFGQRYARAFELAVMREVKRRGFDGYVGGHLHVAGIRRKGRVLYCNDGDWVEHCTALVEHPGGWLSLMQWTETQRVLMQAAPEPGVRDQARPSPAEAA